MEKKKSFIIPVTAFFSVLVVVFAAYLFLFSKNPVTVYSEKGADNGVLVPLNSAAQRACSKNGNFAFFKFTDVQQHLIKSTYEDKKSVSVVFRISVKFPGGKALSHFENVESIPLKIGFLEKKDFDSSGKLDFNIQDHNLITCELKNTLDYEKPLKTYDISFALPFDKVSGALEKREGIFIQSDVNAWLQSVSVSQSVTGFDVSPDISFWGFSSNGGKLDFNSAFFDFTGSSNIFPVVYSKDKVPPEIEIKMAQPSSKEEELYDYSFSFGGEKIHIKRLSEIKISTLALKNPFANMSCKNTEGKVLSVLYKQGSESILKSSEGDIVNPIQTDPGLILNWPKENWRNPDYELFEWDRLPGILFFDTKNYAVQSKFFARIAFFIEKEGFKGKLLTNAELEGKHDYNAHDYSAESLAKFFNKAFRLNFRLNPEEELLLDILVRNGVLKRVDDVLNPYGAGKGAVLSVSREIPSWNRVPLLAHEGWHTIYFTDEDFRNYVSVVYNIMDRQTMDFLMTYFRSQPSLGYDQNDEYLMQNEFMAYILQNGEGKAGEYFVNKARWPSVRKVSEYLCDYIIETSGSGFDDCLYMLQDYLYDKYNLKAGSIGLCSY